MEKITQDFLSTLTHIHNQSAQDNRAQNTLSSFMENLQKIAPDDMQISKVVQSQEYWTIRLLTGNAGIHLLTVNLDADSKGKAVQMRAGWQHTQFAAVSWTDAEPRLVPVGRTGIAVAQWMTGPVPGQAWKIATATPHITDDKLTREFLRTIDEEHNKYAGLNVLPRDKEAFSLAMTEIVRNLVAGGPRNDFLAAIGDDHCHLRYRNKKKKITSKLDIRLACDENMTTGAYLRETRLAGEDFIWSSRKHFLPTNLLGQRIAAWTFMVIPAQARKIAKQAPALPKP